MLLKKLAAPNGKRASVFRVKRPLTLERWPLQAIADSGSLPWFMNRTSRLMF
jgi:hypothetical protein